MIDIEAVDLFGDSASERPVERSSEKNIKSTRSWADLSEDMDDADEGGDGLIFEAQYLRERVQLELNKKETERETSWAGVSAVLDELPNKVAGVLAKAITDATGDDLHIPEQTYDVPADHRNWSSEAGRKEEQHISYPAGLLSETEPWVSAISELGQWYELRRPQGRIGMISGVVLTGDKKTSWVEIVKLKTCDALGIWSDVDGGVLFQACRNCSEPVEVWFEPIPACAVRIYPVVWKGSISLHAALLEPKRDVTALGDEASKALREDANIALQGMLSNDLEILCKWDQRKKSEGPARSSKDIAELVSTLYSIPTKVADAASRFETSVLKAWKEKTRADSSLQEARDWVESIPEDQPLAMAARAQAAAMDQVSEALMVLEELHTVTASSVADSVLRAKMCGPHLNSTASERERVRGRLERKAASKVSSGNSSKQHRRGGRSAASSCTLETVAENEDADPQVKEEPKKLEFWLDLFLNGHAFRIGGPGDSLIWVPEEKRTTEEDGGEHPSVYSDRFFEYRFDDEVQHGSSRFETGTGAVGEVIHLKGSPPAERTVFVNVVLRGQRTSATLAPLRLLSRDGMFKSIHTECENIVIQRVGSMNDEALSFKDGCVQLTNGQQGWEYERLYRHWLVTKNDKGSYRFRFSTVEAPLELAADGNQLVLKESGLDWRLSPVSGEDNLAVHLMAGSGSLALLPGGLLEFSTDRNRWVSWHVFQHSHGSEKPAAGCAFNAYQLEPRKGVFHAASIWRKGRDLNVPNVPPKHEG
jgi:hypothetical protein